MNYEAHRRRHLILHNALDELLADYLRAVEGSLPSTTTIRQLMEWSYLQTKDPTEPPRHAMAFCGHCGEPIEGPHICNSAELLKPGALEEIRRKIDEGWEP